MRKLFLSTVAAAAVLSSGAFAADLPVRGPAVAPAPVFVQMNWTGFYIGAQVGYAFGRTTARSGQFPGVFNQAYSYDPDGAFGGLHAGFNYQMGSLVLGVEADGNGSGVRKTGVGTLGFLHRTTVDWDASLRLRAGVAFDRALLYVTGGVAAAEVKITKGNPVTFATYAETRVGWTVGAGLEYKLTNNWTARAEYRYSDYGADRFQSVAVNSQDRSVYRTHSVRVGLSYLFGGPAGPVVAKY